MTCSVINLLHTGMPFGRVPVLEVDGKVTLCGHVNIARYIAEKYGNATLW